jgi:hypothetical protein
MRMWALHKEQRDHGNRKKGNAEGQSDFECGASMVADSAHFCRKTRSSGEIIDIRLGDCGASGVEMLAQHTR